MRVFTVIKRVIRNPFYVFTILGSLRLLNWMPDAMYLRLRYRAYMRQHLNLKDPKLFTEKLQWLKLHDRKPEYAQLVDKYQVRSYIKERFGERYLIPLLGVWDSPNDIDFSTLPNQFVMKCTHDSGGIVYCTDKSSFDVAAAKRKLDKCLKRNYFIFFREYPYKDVKPRIICEKYMLDEGGTELKDYKVFCFNGKPTFILVDFDRLKGHKRNIYNTEWQFVPFEMNRFYSDPSIKFSKPSCLNEMLALAKQISENHAFLRVDFYIIESDLYLGEITFYPGAGLLLFEPPEYDRLLGNLLELPKV